MKKVAIALVLALLLMTTFSGVALAKAQKVPLIQHPSGSDPGSGFVVFNDTSGPDNLQIEMSLKGAMPNTSYDVYVHIEGTNILAGTVTTNKKGNANFHYSASVTSGVLQQTGLALWRLGVGQIYTGAVSHYVK